MDYSFDNCDKKFKDSLIIKIQDRKFDSEDDIRGEKRCFAFCELVRLQIKKLHRANRKEHSDLYQSHFYAPSPKDPSKYQLYIVMNKCKIILDDLIKKVHKLKPNHTYDKNYVPDQKFPVSVLIALCKLFYDSRGWGHNDLKPQNIGFSVKNGKIVPEYIDLGSAGTGNSQEESIFDDVLCDDEKYPISRYPSTLLYLSCNKVPDVFSLSAIYFGDDDDNMNMMKEIQETKDLNATLKTTCKQAKPNCKFGFGDNMWANCITLIEMMNGQHPVMINGEDLDSILETLKEHDFYSWFINSEVYKKYYKDDEKFRQVEEFLRLGLERDPVTRDATNFEWASNMFKKIEMPSDLKSDLSKYYNF